MKLVQLLSIFDWLNIILGPEVSSFFAYKQIKCLILILIILIFVLTFPGYAFIVDKLMFFANQWLIYIHTFIQLVNATIGFPI